MAGNPKYDKQRRYQLRLRKEKQEFVWAFLKENPCVDCGEADPIVLEFDHVRGTKVKNISQMVADYCKWEALVAEIEKCEVRCANCHRRRTAIQLGYFNPQ